MEKPHRKLHVWQEGVNLVLDVYRITSGFPTEERFGLTGQMRRSAVSIPSNVAEGLARKTPSEKVQFIHVAMGSLSELDTQVEISSRLGYLSEERRLEIDNRLTQIDKMLVGLRNRIAEKRASKMVAP